MYKLTEKGKEEVRHFINECLAKRKEILDAGKDTASETNLPTEEDIIADLELTGSDDDGIYRNGWGVTDHYNSDYPLCLVPGEDFRITEENSTLRMERKIHELIEEFKKQTVSEIADAEPPEGVREISDNAVSVPAGTVFADGCILSPEYYLQESQAAAVEKKISSVTQMHALVRIMKDMAETGKVTDGSNTYRLNDNTVRILRQAAENMENAAAPEEKKEHDTIKNTKRHAKISLDFDPVFARRVLAMARDMREKDLEYLTDGELLLQCLRIAATPYAVTNIRIEDIRN